MRRFGRILGRILLVLLALFAAAWALAPVEPVDRVIAFDAAAIGPDIQAWLDRSEFQLADLNPAAAKRVV